MIGDVLAQADLTIWPVLALMVFFPLFIGVAIRIMQPSRKMEYQAAARMPLEDEE